MISQSYLHQQQMLHDNPAYGVASLHFAPLVAAVVRSALAQIPRWLEDYNDNHPHKALRMKSPREFIRSFHQPAANCPI